MVHRRPLLPVHRHQLHRPPDAQRPGAVPQDRVRLEQRRLRAHHHLVPRRLRLRADGGGAGAGPRRHAHGTEPRRRLLLGRRDADVAGIRPPLLLRLPVPAGRRGGGQLARRDQGRVGVVPAPGERLGVALFDSGSSIGGAVAPVLVLWIFHTFGSWRPAFIITGRWDSCGSCCSAGSTVLRRRTRACPPKNARTSSPTGPRNSRTRPPRQRAFPCGGSSPSRRPGASSSPRR